MITNLTNITDDTYPVYPVGDDPRQYNLTGKEPVYVTDSLQPLDRPNTLLDQSDSISDDSNSLTSISDNTTLLNLIDCILYYTDKKSLSTIEVTKVLNKILTLLVG